MKSALPIPNQDKPPAFESRLIPVLSEGVDLVQMLLFKKLKDALTDRYADRGAPFVSRLAASLVNAVFDPSAETSATPEDQAEVIKRELQDLAVTVADLLIPITDALRIQALCDHQEGRNSTDALRQAGKLGILLADRELPLPHNFIHLARRLGTRLGLVVPPQAQTAADA